MSKQVLSGFAKLFGYRGSNPGRLISSGVYNGDLNFVINGILDLDFTDEPKLELVRAAVAYLQR